MRNVARALLLSLLLNTQDAADANRIVSEPSLLPYMTPTELDLMRMARLSFPCAQA